LDATSGAGPEGSSMRVVRDVRHIFQMFYSIHRNRELDERMERFQIHVENMNSLMQ
jgi:hypothetical protein